jgi:transcriptional regulator with XRE-family HTH domain
MMKEINLARVLAGKRREKGITQDELAEYIGVSKASVSKWETGQSYPDVTFLPLLAAYFNISIDELMDYRPQMVREDIKKLYCKLSSDFAVKPFDAVMKECRAAVKKYYACFPLLFQMGTLIVNHVELIRQEAKKSESLIAEAKALFRRVREESGEASLSRQAQFMEALCCLASGDANGALELLDGTVEPAMPPESLMASAYQMTGRTDDAKAVLQIGMYQNLVVLFNFLPAYLMLHVNDPEIFEETLWRADAVIGAFELSRLHPAVLSGFFLCAAQGYAAMQNQDKTIETLRKYTDLVASDIYPLSLHGDSFFDRIDGWLIKLDLGNSLPRDDKTIRKSMADAVLANPAFAAFSGDPRFQSIKDKLTANINR